MDITPIHRRVIGLDVHQNKITACALIEQADSGVAVEQREFGGFKRHRRALAAWVHGFAPDLVVMESTGIYWKSPYAALENVGIAAWVVNARHVKNVPGVCVPAARICSKPCSRKNSVPSIASCSTRSWRISNTWKPRWPALNSNCSLALPSGSRR